MADEIANQVPLPEMLAGRDGNLHNPHDTRPDMFPLFTTCQEG